jgi:hypothetical protein
VKERPFAERRRHYPNPILPVIAAATAYNARAASRVL